MHRLRQCAVVPGALALLLLAACGVRGGGGPRGSAGGGIVLEGEQLRARYASGLLQSLEGHVTSMRVQRRPGTCPEVTFRGRKTVLGSASAAVYLDGSPMADTCILEQLRVDDVERVEIYPGGHAPHPGYRGDPHGLILIFLTGR